MKKKRYHHGDLRAGLIEAARLLVEERGPERLTMSEASRAAEIVVEALLKPDDAYIKHVLQETNKTLDRRIQAAK